VDHQNSSMDSVRRMVFCDGVAEFVLWETDDPANACRTESGAPCGSELPSRNGARGWEVCEECLKTPALIAALKTGLK
jgi:hypothetical protein